MGARAGEGGVDPAAARAVRPRAVCVNVAAGLAAVLLWCW